VFAISSLKIARFFFLTAQSAKPVPVMLMGAVMGKVSRLLLLFGVVRGQK
jgi:hypothetical protein